MAEMDSPSLGNRVVVKTVLSKLAFRTCRPSWWIVRWSKKTGLLAQVPRETTTPCFGRADHLDIATIECLDPLWKIPRRPSLYHPRSLFPRCTINTNFRVGPSRLGPNIRKLSGTMFASALNNKMSDAALLHKKRTTLQTRTGLMRRQPQARATKQIGLHQCFPRFERSFRRRCWNRLDHELWKPVWLGKSHRVSGCFLCLWNKPILQGFLGKPSQRPYRNRWGTMVSEVNSLNLIAEVLSRLKVKLSSVRRSARLFFSTNWRFGWKQTGYQYLQEVAEEVKTSGGSRLPLQS